MEEQTQTEAPEATEVVEETPEETPQPEQVPEQADDEQDVTNEVATETETTPQQVKEEEEAMPFQLPEDKPVAPFTPEDLKIDPETGEVDVSALLQTFNDKLNQAQSGAVAQSMSQVEIRDQYKTEWDKADKKYPQLKENPKLREMVYAIHADALERGGKWKSPTKAADELFNLTSTAKQEGIQNAQQSVTVQKAAALESSTNSSGSSQTASSNLQAQLNSTNPEEAAAARRAILKQRIQEGRI